jgi:hypothetical protein
MSGGCWSGRRPDLAPSTRPPWPALYARPRFDESREGIKEHEMTAVSGSLHRVQLECRRSKRVREQGE